MDKANITGYSLSEFSGLVREMGEEPFRAAQVFEWIYKKGVTDFSLMTNLPLALKNSLSERFVVLELELKDALISRDGTRKFLFGLPDGNSVEAVYIPASGRATGCISTQVGCKFSCRFCASGMLGFKRDLSCAEIIQQVLYLKNGSPDKKITHLVFMGTGEPLDNYENVIKAVKLINAPEGFNIGARRITISSVGIVPAIRKLAAEGMQIELSISLHAADDRTRSSIMAVNRLYPIAELIRACRDYARATGRQVTFEYILIRGLNSDLQTAQNLAKILRGWNCKINLIPYNPVEESGFFAPARGEISDFKNRLLKSGVNATLRKPRGQDINAACGQLRLRHAQTKNR